MSIFCRFSPNRIVGIRHFHYNGWYNPPNQDVKPIAENTTALIFGWAGAQPKYVQTYSKLYANEFGIGAHGYILPMDLTFNYDQEAQRKLAQECLEQVGKMNTGNKLVIHCFSNNGFAFYKHVSQLLLEENNANFQLIGGILDSCPGPLSFIPYLAQYLGLEKSIHADTPLLFPWKLPLVYGYFQFTEEKRSILVSIFKGFSMILPSFMNYFKYERSLEWAGNYMKYKENYQFPLLFLYSKKDDLMAHSYVSKVIHAKKAQNPQRMIISKLYEKSSHVAHIRTYPDSYRSEIKGFISKVA